MRTEGGEGLQAGTLLEAIGRINAVYVEEAERWQGKGLKKRAGYLRIAAAAACLLLVAGGTFAALRMSRDEGSLSGAGGDYGAESGSVQEAAGEAPENDMAEESAAETGGSDSDEEAAGGGPENEEKEHKFEIPGDIREITVIHRTGQVENTVTVEGPELSAFRVWAESLVLGEALEFAEGEASGTDTQEVFVFRYGEQEASYYKGSVCYLVVGECRYPVENPGDPPGSF